MEDVAFNLGQTCRRDFLEIAFLAVNGHGVAAEKLLRGLYERAVTLEYIRRHPNKAERFVRFGVIQEYKVLKTALDLVGADEFDKHMGDKFPLYQKLYDEVRGEFQVTDCKKCKSKRLAFSWDIDLASMVRALGEPPRNRTANPQIKSRIPPSKRGQILTISSRKFAECGRPRHCAATPTQPREGGFGRTDWTPGPPIERGLRGRDATQSSRAAYYSRRSAAALFCSSSRTALPAWMAA
jgi:Family of unknown function (DUF5677)